MRREIERHCGCVCMYVQVVVESESGAIDGNYDESFHHHHNHANGQRKPYLEELLINLGIRRYLHIVGLLVELGCVVVEIRNTYDHSCCRRELGRFAIVHYHDLIIKGETGKGFRPLLCLVFCAISALRGGGAV